MNVVRLLNIRISFASSRNACCASKDTIVRSLQDSLSVLSAELIPIHERLVTVRRQLVALAAKEGSHKAEIKPLAEELRKIDS